MTQTSTHSIRTLLIAALGGEGGGVLADWLVQCARQAGLAVQATSVPGVAQRTGATSYYLEFTTTPCAAEAQPVFALSPAPAGVDVVVASELLEAARMMERGFVTPERTQLIASSSRVYTTLEKMQPHDGRYDAQRVIDLSRVLAREAHWFDMAEMTQQHRTVVSAVMFGALAGAGALPWSRALCIAVIQASGKGVTASVAGFEAAFAQASAHASKSMPTPEATAAHADAVAPDASSASTPHASTPPALTHTLPASLRTLAAHGVARCIDYQDLALGHDYVAKLHTLVQHSAPAEANDAVWQEAARHLALWLCYEDIIRVADLKTRPERFAEVSAQARVQAGEVVRITEHFKPGAEEVASILPRALGEWLLRRTAGTTYRSLHIRSNSVWGFLMLRALAGMRRWRRASLRHAQEQGVREPWWQALCSVMAQTPSEAQHRFALTLAGLPQVLKGYGDTQLRGRQRYQRLWDAHVQPVLAGAATTAQTLTPEAAQAFAQALKAALHDAPAEPTPDTSSDTSPSAVTHPVLWLKPSAAKTAPSSQP
jgi:indolepyruvate ferredoxin oxidoreductase beta subunit